MIILSLYLSFKNSTLSFLFRNYDLDTVYGCLTTKNMLFIDKFIQFVDIIICLKFYSLRNRRCVNSYYLIKKKKKLRDIEIAWGF